MKHKNPVSIACLFALLLSACGGGDSGTPPAPPPPANNPPALPAGTVGAAGGTVNGPSGSQVVIPAGALTQNVTINIEQSSAGAPPLPANMVAAGEIFALTPHGTSFATPATVTIPFDPAQIPQGETPLLYKTNAAQTGWEPVTGATVSGATMTGQISGFSWILTSRIPPPPPPVFTKDEPKRWYEFNGWDLGNRIQYIAGNKDGPKYEEASPPGILHEWLDFGFPPQPPSGGASHHTVEVFSNETGKTYWVGAQAPATDLLAQLPEDSWSGSATQLRQDQSYQRYAENATMEIVITQVFLEIADYNGTTPSFAGCPWLGADQTEPRDCHDILDAAVSLDVQVLSDSALGGPFMSKTLSSLKGTADLISMSGAPASLRVHGNSHLRQNTPDGPVEHPKHRSVFMKSDFLETGDTQTKRVTLRRTLRIPVDISDTPLCRPEDTIADCKEFTVRIMALATASNRRAGETYARAFLRDPVNFGGEVEVITTGLTPTNRPLPPDVPIDVPVLPDCLDGTEPEAGEVHFTTPDYRIMEFGQVVPQISLVRTGGSTGQVVVTVRSRDGSARAGTHYMPYSRTFVFNDGDDVERAINLQTLDNDDNGGNVSLELELLTKDGCATLGDPQEARVTIVDDEARPVPNNNPSGTLDTTFGEAGKVTIAPFGGEESNMLRQPDGKLVIVGGSFVDFVLARFTENGEPDATFGDVGRVTTDILGGFSAERARAVAMQPDGKLVVAGESSPNNAANFVTLARYNTDGTLDSTFGTGGTVTGPVSGRAWAVAVQADGKIVVAGDQSIANAQFDYGDVLVARFNADGSVDAGFAAGGAQVFDVTASTDQARNVVIQPDGRIVVSGVQISDTGVEPSAIARLNADGSFDTSFGSGGKLSISTARIGHGLALQPDGKLLLAGSTMGFPRSFALMRLNTDGSYDSSFGNGGAVTASITHSTAGVGDRGMAVALRPDGRIYVAGIAGSINHDFGVARFTAAGVLDTTFAGTGSVTFDFNGLEDGAESIAVEPNGKIVLGGYARPTSTDGFGLMRINP